MPSRAVAVAALVVTALGAQAQTKVVFATNWKAQAAHGGFYQALADGTYKKMGLDVEIRQGGPQVNNRPLLPAGKIDFLMTGNLLHSFDNAKNGVPVIVVASMFQKDPQALFAHPDQGYRQFADLKTAPTAFIAKDAQFSWWSWLKAEYGFKDENLKPYNYNLGPFLADKKSIQQGYAVEEPISIEKQGGFKPMTFLLADHGYSTYSTTIEARTEMVKTDPELVRSFVNASVLGWVSYLYGDRRRADALIKRDNPEMTDELLDKSVALMKGLGIVDSGDATTLGIGAMKPERVKDFYDKMVKAGLYKPGEVDLSKVATMQFVNKGVGLDLKKQLGGK
ncbi:ABC transporter substrate-binding protein [Aquincola tertiaricarbonis]|uniref:ABC transporter substrate-binding protein n=1 Tax=Aquincola tertiaricarbonis TaxID=391953 RepID=A0ABY4SGS4_AQUTE|nr:ABC transporter substrate-binding protein [Aquincola tertiaricarbonis]URI10206.1 ABC transporter substrate-binding protein [Aquincola tertiaricarbonis]